MGGGANTNPGLFSIKRTSHSFSPFFQSSCPPGQPFITLLSCPSSSYLSLFSCPVFSLFFIVYIFGGLECVDHSFAYVAHLVFLRDFLISNPESCRSRSISNISCPPLLFCNFLFPSILHFNGPSCYTGMA